MVLEGKFYLERFCVYQSIKEKFAPERKAVIGYYQSLVFTHVSIVNQGISNSRHTYMLQALLSTEIHVLHHPPAVS